MVVKKQYEKPMMAVELYALTQSIAACSFKIGYLASECVINDADATDDMVSLAKDHYFADTSNCMYAVQRETTYEDGICYHLNANAYFNS